MQGSKEYQQFAETDPEFLDAKVSRVLLAPGMTDKIAEVLMNYHKTHMSDIGVLLGRRNGQTTIVSDVRLLKNPNPDTAYGNPLTHIGNEVSRAKTQNSGIRAVGIVEGPGILEDANLFIPLFGLYIAGGNALYSVRPTQVNNPEVFSVWTMDTAYQKLIRIPADRFSEGQAIHSPDKKS